MVCLQTHCTMPLSLEARKLADEGKPIVLEKREVGTSIAILNIIKDIENIFSQ